MKKENNVLVKKCNCYEVMLKGLREKMNPKEQNVEGAVSEMKLEELRKAWEKEQENDKIIFAEVVKHR